MSVSSTEERNGSGTDKASLERRRAATQRVREARDRLTSTSGTRPAFDYELLRQFAQNRLSAALAIFLLIGAVGFMSGLWTGAITAATWTAAVLVINAVILAKCRRFLAEPPSSINLIAWRLRFVLLDLFFGTAWMLNGCGCARIRAARRDAQLHPRGACARRARLLHDAGAPALFDHARNA